MNNGNDRSTSFANRAVFALLCAVPIVATIIYGSVDPLAMSLLAVFAAAIVLFWAADAWQAKEFRFSTNSLQIPLAGLVAIGLVQLLPIEFVRSIEPYETRFFTIRLIIYLIFFAAILVFLNSSARYRTLVLTIVIFGTAMAFFGILQKLADPDAIYGLRPTPQAIPFGPFVNQHHFAAFMEMTGGLTLGLLFGGGTKKDKRLLLAIAAVIMGIAVIFTNSRGGAISIFAVLAFVLFAAFKMPAAEGSERSSGGRRMGIALGGIAIVLITAGVVLFLGAGDALFRGIGPQQANVDVSSGRFHFWNIALKIFAANPVLGTGLETFGMAFTEFDTRSGLYRVERAHNDYLQALTDSGIAGFLCVAAFIVMFFRKSFAAVSAATDKFHRAAIIGAMAGCFGIMIHSFFDFPLRTASNGFVFLALVAIAVMPIELFDRGKHSRNAGRTTELAPAERVRRSRS